jgi:putative membrane protein
VPIEEYLFFVLQTLVVSLWLLFLARRLRPGELQPIRSWSPFGVHILSLLLLWLCAAVFLIARFQPVTYLGLILVWALPPLGLQLAFGADLLWRHSRLILSHWSSTLSGRLTSG